MDLCLGAKFLVPITSGAPMNAGFPIPIRRAVAASAQFGSFVPGQPLPITCFELIELLGIMAIKALVVQVVAAVSHHQVFVLFGENHISVRVDVHMRRFVLLVARVTIQSRGIAAGLDQFRSRESDSRSVREFGIDFGRG